MICKVLKLTTGETLIASIETESTTYVDLHRPIKILIAPRGTDSFSVMMIKWDSSMNFALPVRVFKSSIVSVAEPDQQFKESYMDIFNEYENRNAENELKFDTVDDLSNELEKLVSMMKSSANTTLH